MTKIDAEDTNNHGHYFLTRRHLGEETCDQPTSQYGEPRPPYCHHANPETLNSLANKSQKTLKQLLQNHEGYTSPPVLPALIAFVLRHWKNFEKTRSLSTTTTYQQTPCSETILSGKNMQLYLINQQGGHRLRPDLRVVDRAITATLAYKKLT